MSDPDPIRLEELRGVDDLAGLPDAELAWLAAESTPIELEAGGVIFEAGDRAEYFWIVIGGVAEMTRFEPGMELRSMLVRTGEVTGKLPFSRMDAYPGRNTALEPVRLGRFATSRIEDLLRHAPSVLARLVHVMLDRARRFTRAGAQREKLIGLGTMAAGLAHELNNPASAARRSAAELSDTLGEFGRLATDLVGSAVRSGADGANDRGEPTGPDEDARRPDPVADVRGEAVRTAETTLDPLERTALEDELGDWLDQIGTPHPWEAAATLVAAGYRRDELARTASRLEPGQGPKLVAWLAKEATLRQLGLELAEATKRISTLVAAMKSYSYMDQSTERRPVDVERGIRDTATILGHRLRERGVELRIELPDLPEVLGFGSELNQVWTNLLDNAVAAASEGGGTVTIRGEHHVATDAIVVEICDDGPGVPPELRARIFEPFFTTKGVGEGTGMGLDIANRIVEERHHGHLDVESEPGDTCFRVWLPLDGAPRD